MKCEVCGTKMEALLTSVYCPNEGNHAAVMPMPVPIPYGPSLVHKAAMMYMRAKMLEVCAVPYRYLKGRQ